MLVHLKMTQFWAGISLIIFLLKLSHFIFAIWYLKVRSTILYFWRSSNGLLVSRKIILISIFHDDFKSVLLITIISIFFFQIFFQTSVWEHFHFKIIIFFFILFFFQIFHWVDLRLGSRSGKCPMMDSTRKFVYLNVIFYYLFSIIYFDLNALNVCLR